MAMASQVNGQLGHSIHRLPAVSGSAALLELETNSAGNVTTGLEELDALLSGDSSYTRSFPPGKTTEVWGPMGSGKTALLLQIAKNTVSSGKKVVWLDAMTCVSSTRLEQMLRSVDADDVDPFENWIHTRIESLSHLLAMIHYPQADFPPENTALLIIDGLHSLFDADFPRYRPGGMLRGDQQKWQAGRRQAVLGSVVGAINKLANLKSFAALITTGSATRMRNDTGLGAALVAGVGGPEWDAGIWHRLCIFRDFQSRFIGVQKCCGRSLLSRLEVGEVGRLIPFEAQNDGSLVQTTPVVDSSTVKHHPSPVKPRKRFHAEIADSEGEEEDDYGWVEADNTLIMGGRE